MLLFEHKQYLQSYDAESSKQTEILSFQNYAYSCGSYTASFFLGWWHHKLWNLHKPRPREHATKGASCAGHVALLYRRGRVVATPSNLGVHEKKKTSQCILLYKCYYMSCTHPVCFSSFVAYSYIGGVDFFSLAPCTLSYHVDNRLSKNMNMQYTGLYSATISVAFATEYYWVRLWKNI